MHRAMRLATAGVCAAAAMMCTVTPARAQDFTTWLFAEGSTSSVLGFENELLIANPNPGDVVVFNYHILHHAGAGMNPHAKRRALAILYADERIAFGQCDNPVPGPVEHAGKTWREGQTLSDFPEIFPVV